MSDIIVIGAGVIGLSAALCLQKAGYKVTIVARDFPSPSETIDRRALVDYASHWAGAHNRWVIPTTPGEERDHALAVTTFRHMARTSEEHPEAGITFVPGIEYLDTPGLAQRSLTADKALALSLEDFRLLDENDFPDDDVKWGCGYRTWCVNPMVYCCFLLRQFTLLGGQVIRRELRHLHEVFFAKDLPRVQTVVNCSGVGFSDPDVFILRGQTCLVANSCNVTVTRQTKDSSWIFCIPRPLGGGTIIGGTKEPGDWNANPDPQTRERLLKAIASAYPPILADGPLRPLADIVGRRPMRSSGIRLEKEDIPELAAAGLAEGGPRRAIHAYGLGGRGYELSWGVAETVLNLVRQ